jgi:hypothetical protein
VWKGTFQALPSSLRAVGWRVTASVFKLEPERARWTAALSPTATGLGVFYRRSGALGFSWERTRVERPALSGRATRASLGR